MITAQISNKIYIPNAPESVIQWCKTHLEFPNPEYEKKTRMGLWTGNVERRIVLWERKGDTAILPQGCAESIWKDLNIQFSRRAKCANHIDYKCHIQLYPYQDQAQSAVYGKSGVLVMPCGSGKTQTALSLAARYGMRTLWITHTHDLLNQSLGRAKSCYDMDDDMYGTITSGRISVGKAITFATVQTLANIDLTPYTDYWDVVIVDECHKAVGTPTKLMMFYKAVSALNAPIKLGLTATEKRNDGLERCMFALIGPKLHEVSEEAVKHNTVPIHVIMKNSTSYNPNTDYILNGDGTINYTRLIDDVCNCAERNHEIADIVNEINAVGKTCLVLSDRVDHLRSLRDLVGTDYTMQIFAIAGSKQAQQERRDCIEQLRQKNIRCLFATYQLAKEGLDIPSLDCVIFATPKKDRIAVVQSCGRVGRQYDGKHEGIVVDIVDANFSIFVNYSRIRARTYKTKKYTIEKF